MIDGNQFIEFAGKLAAAVSPDEIVQSTLETCGTDEAIVAIKAGIDSYKRKIEGF